VNLDLYSLRQERIDFNTVGFQIISRVGHFIIFNKEKEFDGEQRSTLIRTLASLDYRRDSILWQNNLVIDDGDGNKKIVTQSAAVDKAVKVAIEEVTRRTGIAIKN
jgi:hypothetical protein